MILPWIPLPAVWLPAAPLLPTTRLSSGFHDDNWPGCQGALLLASEFRAVPGLGALIHTWSSERPRDFWSWDLLDWLAAISVLVVLAVSICTAVGSTAPARGLRRGPARPAPGRRSAGRIGRTATFLVLLYLHAFGAVPAADGTEAALADAGRLPGVSWTSPFQSALR